MSFYQPSLSLYDVLDALTNKAGQRGENTRGGYGQRQPSRRSFNPNDRIADPFGAARSAYIPGSYYYSVPSSSYYQPFYYSADEETQPQRRHPTHHHHRHGHRAPVSRAPSGEAAGDNLVEALLAALSGNDSSLYSYQNDEDQNETVQEEKAETTAEKYSDSEKIPDNHDSVEQPTAPALGETEQTSGEKESSASDEYNEDYNMSAHGNKGAIDNSVSADRQEREESQKKKSKIGTDRPEFGSPVPAPLQVSNPEIRLDLPFSPDISVYDTPEQYLVVLALPGANSKEFKIDFHPSSHELLIKGTVENKLGVDEKFIKVSELKYGDFERSVKFPVLPRIKDEDIKATYSNGLLQIRVPKVPQDSEKPQPKKRILIEDVPDEELVFESTPHNVVSNT